MQRCEVLIVGGGPAGAACAWALARAGVDVQVVDRQRFPRDKVCAGWVTPQLMATIELDAAAYASCHVLQPITSFRVGVIGGKAIAAEYPEVVSYGIRRCEFDHYLLQRSGARLLLGHPVKGIERRRNGWRVNGEIEASILIGAGGHFCPVARMLGGGKESVLITAREIEFPLSAKQARAGAMAAGVPELYFCPDLLGYGWCLRKGDFLNIGLGRLGKQGTSRHVAAFVDWLRRQGRITGALPTPFKGHAYLLYGANRPWLDDGVLLIGDAAGLAYAQSGEGIRPAVESGILAAQTVLACRGDYSRGGLSGYADSLVHRFGNPRTPSWAGMLPRGLKRRLAPTMFASPFFVRHILLDRWFLHRHLPPLKPTA